MHGIPVIIKDNFDTADLPTSGGSLALANHQTRDDAFVVRRLRDAGAIIIGKSNMHELAAGITTISSLGGQTRNPYDPRRCPGGSSGGTGAAIAASFAAVGWGSDTCGSIRIPSAFGSLAGSASDAGPRQPKWRDAALAYAGHPGSRSRGPSPISRSRSTYRSAWIPRTSQTQVLVGRPVPRFTDSLRGRCLTRRSYRNPRELHDQCRRRHHRHRPRGGSRDEAGWRRHGARRHRELRQSGRWHERHQLRAQVRHDRLLSKTPGEPVKSIADILASGLESSALEARFKLADSLGTRDNAPYRRALARQAVLRARIAPSWTAWASTRSSIRPCVAGR